MAHPLEALTFPLHGNRLIEASAGTGKTYTIAALYLRLVLGHGGENGFVRPLTPPEILVVTFTNAATEELRDRIRSRLTEAAAFFRGRGNRDEYLSCFTRRVSGRPVARQGQTTGAGRPMDGRSRPSTPFIPGASACCASTPLTAAACLIWSLKPMNSRFWKTPCVIIGATICIPCRPRLWRNWWIR